VVGVPDPYRGERVKGYIVLEPGAQEKTVSDELISFCKQRIADYKVPSELEFILQMPKTSAGKIDRRAFREKH
jgi:long-chain acyl-CoA synthetase